MKGFPYSLPEMGFITLVMVLPLIVGFAWPSETVFGFICKVVISMVVGLCIWLALISVAARRFDQKKQDQQK
jgi:uncharacterized membrane protein YhaH (DUF805 family)